MNCPKCGATDICVIDSRIIGDTVRRRRGCAVCNHRFTTYEVSEKQYAVLRKIEELMEDGKAV